MKIAVTYENGMVFQHFGKSEAFKYYETDEWGDIVAAEVKSTNGQGHGALAEILKENGVDVLICGGIAQGAQDALAENGIEVYAGNAGAADGVLLAFLAGKIEKQDVKCDHHDHEHGEGHTCGEHGFHIVEFYNEHHPDPNGQNDAEDEFFRFEKIMN